MHEAVWVYWKDLATGGLKYFTWSYVIIGTQHVLLSPALITVNPLAAMHPFSACNKTFYKITLMMYYNVHSTLKHNL